MTIMSEQREHVSVEIFRAIIRQATEKKRVPEYVSVHIVNAREVLCELDDIRTQLAAAQSEVSYLKGLYEDANGLRAAAEHRAETAERERDVLQKLAALQDAWETEAMGDITMLLKERNEYRHRAERLGQQLDAVRSLCDDMQDYTALKVLELLDDASEGEG